MNDQPKPAPYQPGELNSAATLIERMAAEGKLDFLDVVEEPKKEKRR